MTTLRSLCLGQWIWLACLDREAGIGILELTHLTRFTEGVSYLFSSSIWAVLTGTECVLREYDMERAGSRSFTPSRHCNAAEDPLESGCRSEMEIGLRWLGMWLGGRRRRHHMGSMERGRLGDKVKGVLHSTHPVRLLTPHSPTSRADPGRHSNRIHVRVSFRWTSPLPLPLPFLPSHPRPQWLGDLQTAPHLHFQLSQE